MKATPVDFVQQQIDVYRNQSEQWKVDHEEAMACRNLEDAIRFGTAILASISRRNDSKAKVLVSDVSAVCGLYCQWHQDSLPLLAAIDEMERRNYVVDGADDFRAKVHGVSCVTGQLDRIGRGAQAVVDGNGVPLTEAINAIDCAGRTERI